MKKNFFNINWILLTLTIIIGTNSYLEDISRVEEVNIINKQERIDYI